MSFRLHQSDEAKDNLLKNQSHYDQKYRDEDVAQIVRDVKNASKYIDNAMLIHPSWAGLYLRGFRDELQGANVLELGAGNGMNSLMMLALGAAHVVAVELSEVTTFIINEAAAQLNMLDQVEVRIGDFVTMDFVPDTFDMVVGKNFLHHLTHHEESIYITKMVTLLRPTGSARFFEPATNSRLLDNIRWMMPVPGRPSRLQKQTFAAYKEADPHPERDNSSAHYYAVFQPHFKQIEIIPTGGLQRFHRLLPDGELNRTFRRFTSRLEKHLPHGLHMPIARSQTIILKQPIKA